LPSGASAQKIGDKLGVSKRTVFAWKADPAFKAEVAGQQREWRENARNGGIADQDRRLKYLNDRHMRLRRIIRTRSESLEYESVPGGNTGLLTKRANKAGGEDFIIDTELLAELRQLETNAAIELGQWKSRTVIEKPDSNDDAIAIAMSELFTGDQLRELAAKAAELQREAILKISAETLNPRARPRPRPRGEAAVSSAY
jgi:hypothetical protein